MTANLLADQHARLNVLSKEMCESFVVGGLEPLKAEKLTHLLHEKEYQEFLEISRGYVNSMAFLDQEQMVQLLNQTYGLLADSLNVEMKILKRKLNTMEADAKQAGTPAHDKAINHYASLERNKKHVMIISSEYRIAATLKLQPFLDDPKHDATEAYKAVLGEGKK
jgi:hypothetical protein